MIIDGHVMVGQSRSASLGVADLLRTMDELGIEATLIAPPEPFMPIRNREGNELVANEAAGSGGRLRTYAVATPWLGEAAREELERARSAGAVALKLDPALQGFDLLDGSVDPLVEFSIEASWPIYVRTGTPPHSLPLQVAWLAARHPEANFIIGKSGATDFAHDGPAALRSAPNLYADSAYVEWPTALAAGEPDWAGGRVVFSTDAPFADPVVELARVTETKLTDSVRAAVLGETLASLLGT